MTMRIRTLNSEVLEAEGPVVNVARADIELLKKHAARNERKRTRLCAHRGVSDLLHEMLIVHERDTYVRPHKHPGKSESIHIIEGLVDVVVFGDDGRIEGVVLMGDYASGKTFYCRMAVPVFHTLIIRSDVLVFHETINGPFDRRDTVFAPWAPEAGDINLARTFMADLDDGIRLIQ